MNKNKGFIGLGLIVAIVLGIVVVGCGAYYLGKGGSKQEVNNLPVLNEKTTNINPQVINTLNSSINVISPNGGEVYKDSDKIAIKWTGTVEDRVAIYLRFSSGEWCFVKDLPSSSTNYTFTPYGHNCGGDGRGSISGIQKYKITLIAYENGGMAPEPGTAFATSYDDNDGSGPGFIIDSSDNYFTINSDTKITCKDNPNYLVVSKSLGSETGTDILIKYKNSNKNVSCIYKVDATDFEIKNNGDQYFYAINKNLLILDSGTGPENRGVIIYNLDTRKKVFNDTYNMDGVENLNIKGNTMTYWSTDLKQIPTAQNCPQYYNSNGAIVSHFSLDLSTLIKKDLGENKCVYRQ